MLSSSFREMLFGRVYGLPAWAWAGIVCLLVVGTALVPVPVALTDDTPADAERVGAFTDGESNSSATVTYEVRKQDQGGVGVYDASVGEYRPDVRWESEHSGEWTERGVLSYDADSGAYYQSATIRFADERVWNYTVWGDSDEVYKRVEWTDGMRDVEEYRSVIAGNDTDVVVRESGPTTTIISRTRQNFSVSAANRWWVYRNPMGLGPNSDAPFVSPSGDLVTGAGVAGGSVQVTDEPGVSYAAAFDYTYVPPEATEGVQAVYGEGHVPLIVRVLLVTTDIQGELNRTPGASGIPEDKPDWTTAVSSENASE